MSVRRTTNVSGLSNKYYSNISNQNADEIQDKQFTIRQKKAILSKIRLDNQVKQRSKMYTSNLEGAALKNFLEK